MPEQNIFLYLLAMRADIQKKWLVGLETYCYCYCLIKLVTRRGEAMVGALPALLQNLENIILILGKNALIVVNYGLNFSFKI